MNATPLCSFPAKKNVVINKVLLLKSPHTNRRKLKLNMDSGTVLSILAKCYLNLVSLICRRSESNSVVKVLS